MKKHRTIEEKIEILNNYFTSGLSMTKYGKLINIAPTTLFDWVKKYNQHINNNDSVKDTNELICTSENKVGFYTLTNDIKPITNITPVKNSNIKLTKNDISLEFDVNILRQVIEAFK